MQQLSGIRPPLAKIVVDIDRGDACRTGRLLQAGERLRNRERPAKDVFSVRKLEMIDYIDEKERDARLMADIARALFHDVGNRWAAGTAGGFLRFKRASTSFIVNWLPDSRSSSSFHEIGSATGAPGRARTA